MSNSKNINYKNKCYKCIEDINTIEDFNIKTEEIYNILYNDKTFKIDTLWKRQNMVEFFGEQYNPFVTSVLVLLGYKLHEKNMINKNYSNIQEELYKKRVTEALVNDIYVRELESIRISQMIWAAYFINTKLIEVGRLQYHCDSWLLSNQINDIIDSNSNIAKFYNLFEVQDGPDAQKDILNFVFNMQECDDYNNLLEDTSLQRLLKKQLLENKSIKIGWGKLKKELL